MTAVAVLTGCSGETDTERADPSPGEDAAAATSKGEPKRLEIPRLDVDARVISLGTAPDGAQEVPDSVDDTAWWRDGSAPGEDGNAVIVGHTASKDHGVFDRLSTLRDGDRITVHARAGAVDYTVTGTSAVDVDQFGTVADEVYRTTGPSGLVLLTCGDWNGRDYDTTIIVRASLAA
jgi:LPXTG-site transpeptidase (sortase) family protein